MGVIRGQEHFDGDTSKHSHFVCSGCGRVLDIFEPVVPEEILAEIQKKHDFHIMSEDILFNGVCPDCKVIETEE